MRIYVRIKQKLCLGSVSQNLPCSHTLMSVRSKTKDRNVVDERT